MHTYTFLRLQAQSVIPNTACPNATKVWNWWGLRSKIAFRVLSCKSAFSLLRRLSAWRCPHLLPSSGARCTAPAAHPQLSINSPAGRALSSKPAARHCCCRLMDQTDGRTDKRTLDRCIDPAPHTMLAVSVSHAFIFYSLIKCYSGV